MLKLPQKNVFLPEGDVQVHEPEVRMLSEVIQKTNAEGQSVQDLHVCRSIESFLGIKNEFRFRWTETLCKNPKHF